VSFTDADLIARVLSHGDQNAFGELVRRYQSVVRAFLARMTRGDVRLADDLAQETFLKAWQKRPTYRSGPRFSTWPLPEQL
jgi:RNA polymerase sigma-70 factor (ECF subfamily)